MSYGIQELASGGRRLALGFVAALLLPVAAAVAEEAPAPDAAAAPADQAPAAAAPAPAQPSTAAWLKVCGTDPNTKKQACVVSQEIRAESGQPIASISLQPTPDPKKFGVGIVVPLGFVMPPGIALNVDGEKKATAQFVVCIPGQQKQPAACIAQAAVTDDFVGSLKKGNKLEMMITTAQGKTVPVEVTLVGFAKVYDGPGIDRAAAEGVRQELAKGLQERADEARKKLIEQQQKELQGETPQN
jgi:invasion protein IalB